jgi:hypothetical protein
MSKPIRVFFSPLSRRFYASRAYKEEAPGVVTITGEKFDVTNDIAELFERYDVVFKRRDDADSKREQEEVSKGLAND